MPHKVHWKIKDNNFQKKKNVFTKKCQQNSFRSTLPSQDEPSLLGIIIYEVCKSFLFALPIIPPIQETLGMCLLSEWMNWVSEWFMGPLSSRGLYCMCWLYFRACHLTLDITGVASLSITKFYLLWNCANASQPSRWRCLFYMDNRRASFRRTKLGLKRLLGGCYLILPMWWVPSDFFGWAPSRPAPRYGAAEDGVLLSGVAFLSSLTLSFLLVKLPIECGKKKEFHFLISFLYYMSFYEG